MTKREFALLLVRLLGLYTITTSFNSLVTVTGYLIGALSPPPNPKPNLSTAFCFAIPFVLQSGFGLTLWIFAPTLAHFTTSEMRDEIMSRWKPRQVTQVALVLLGVLMLGNSIGGIGQTFSRYAFLAMGRATPSSNASLVFNALGSVPLLFAGCILIRCARFLAFWLSPRESVAVELSANADYDKTAEYHDQT